MKKLWICLAVIAISTNVAFAYDSDEQDDWQNYDSYEDNGDLTDINSYEFKDLDEFNLVENMTKTRNPDRNFDIGDYQVEDNRSQLNEDISDDMTDDLHLHIENSADVKKERADLSSTELNNLGIDVNNFENDKNIILPKSVTKYLDEEHSDTPEQTSVTVEQKGFEFEKKIFEDTKSILNEDNQFQFAQSVELENENVSDDLNELIAQTRRLLDETQDSIMDDEYSDSGKNGSQVQYNEASNKETTKEDTTSQAIDDLIADLDRLKETWSKLNDEWNLETSDNSEDIENKSDDKNSDSLIYPNEILDKEINKSQPILYLNDALLASESEKADAHAKTESVLLSTESTMPKWELIQETELPNIAPANKEVLSESGISSTIGPEISNQFDLIYSKSVTSRTDFTEKTDTKGLIPTTEDFSSVDVDELMKNFKSQYEITQITENDMRSAKKIWLTTQIPTEITSPEYPNPYPTDTITDWMFTAAGMGIELNITDVDINGSAGDYVLVIPGGVDESGSSGLLFSYHLVTERRYRFLSVDKMFVRFHAKPGEPSARGFRFSIRTVVPLRELPLPEPEPERVIPAPSETITLNLGGVSLEGFLKIEEQFRKIVAEMAAMYISDNNIEPGVNSTLAVTQITSRALCFHNWPKFQHCAEVRFGVPLIFDDEVEREPRLNVDDLTDMWNTYSQVYTIAEQLRVLGITEFQVPNDRGVMIVWLCIAGGVVISMAMLAFALWRFSCFEDYTRMPTFNDTDSVKEKRNLDLYPTPHQTLPPLYTETDYEWADAKYDDCTKVDVGGYANKSYVPENPYDLDSDEDIVPASARNTSFSPRDIYNV